MRMLEEIHSLVDVIFVEEPSLEDVIFVYYANEQEEIKDWTRRDSFLFVSMLHSCMLGILYNSFLTRNIDKELGPVSGLNTTQMKDRCTRIY